MALPWESVVGLCALIVVAGCGVPIEFRNAGSKHTLAEDQQACDRELQSPASTSYRNGQLNPWQVCIERKGWKRVDARQET